MGEEVAAMAEDADKQQLGSSVCVQGSGATVWSGLDDVSDAGRTKGSCLIQMRMRF